MPEFILENNFDKCPIGWRRFVKHVRKVAKLEPNANGSKEVNAALKTYNVTRVITDKKENIETVTFQNDSDYTAFVLTWGSMTDMSRDDNDDDGH